MSKMSDIDIELRELVGEALEVQGLKDVKEVESYVRENAEEASKGFVDTPYIQMIMHQHQ